MKKIITFFLISILSFGLFSAKAQDNVHLYLFYSKTCPHCYREKDYLQELMQEKSNLRVFVFEVSSNRNGAVLFSRVGKFLNADVSGVPFTVIGSQYFTGFGSAETTGEVFKKALQNVETGQDRDLLYERFGEDLEKFTEPFNIDDREVTEAAEDKTNEVNPEDLLDLPVFGRINTKEISLPLLTFLIALVDGFNPCAMWVLIFLISLLLGIEDRKKMWILGFTFIAASAFVYFLFMVAWLNFFIFFGFISWVRILIGLLAIFFGVSHAYSFFKNKSGGCEVTQKESRVRTLNQIKKIVLEKKLLPAMLGMVILAFAVNLIEALCSAGLPAVYTKVLTMSNLPSWQYYMYIIFYQIIFMLDDMVVFVIAMVSLKSVAVESKYARWSKIIGAFVMLIIGLLLIFNPSLLSFK